MTMEIDDAVSSIIHPFLFPEIFVRLCHFLRQSGHTEKAVAAYQALLEFNFRAPASVAAEGADHEIKLALFEAFWDAEVTRFGEADAPGWAKWMQNKTQSYPCTNPEDEGT